MWQETLKVKVGARKYISCLVISTEKPQRLFALFKGGFSFFSQGGGGGGKILGGVQVIRNMPFLMLWKGHEMAN